MNDVNNEGVGCAESVMDAIRVASEPYQPSHVVAATATCSAVMLGRFLAGGDVPVEEVKLVIEGFAAQFVSAANTSYSSALDEFAEMEFENELG